MNINQTAGHTHVTLSTVLDHVYVFVVTLVLSAATTFIIGYSIIGQR